MALHLRPVVAHPEHRAAKTLQHGLQLQFQLQFEGAVQSGEGLVQENGLGLGGEDAHQRHPLLLPAGELGGVVLLKTCEVEGFQKPPRRLGAAFFRLAVQGGGDVLRHGHVGEEGVLLKEISYAPLLGRQVDTFPAVKEHLAVQFDVTPIRAENPGNALECHAFAAAGGAQQRQSFVSGLEVGLEVEVPQVLFHVNCQRHGAVASFPVMSAAAPGG